MLSQPEWPVLFNCIHHEDDVAGAWYECATWWHHPESQEHERLHKDSSVSPVVSETHNDMATLKFFLGVLQESNETFLGALRQNAFGDFHIEGFIPQDSFPSNFNIACQFDPKAQIRGYLCFHQTVDVICCQMSGDDRGLF